VDERERAVDQPVADPVEPRHRPRLDAVEPVADDVLGPSLDDGLEHRVCVGRVVRAVPVGHQHDRRVGLADALADRLALSRTRLDDHAGAVLLGDPPGAVGRPSVDDEDVLVAAFDEPAHHLADGPGLVEGREQDADVRTGVHHRSLGGVAQKPAGSVAAPSSPEPAARAASPSTSPVYRRPPVYRVVSSRVRWRRLLPALAEVLPHLGASAPVGDGREVIVVLDGVGTVGPTVGVSGTHSYSDRG